MEILDRLQKSLDDMYEFSNKLYAAIEKSGKDIELAELVTSAKDRDEIFLAEQLAKVRSAMDEPYALIEYLHRPVIYDGRLKKHNDGSYSLCDHTIRQRVGIEYVKDDRWQIGLLQPEENGNGFEIVDQNIKKVDIELENLRVRCREKLR